MIGIDLKCCADQGLFTISKLYQNFTPNCNRTLQRFLLLALQMTILEGLEAQKFIWESENIRFIRTSLVTSTISSIYARSLHFKINILLPPI